MRLDPNTLGDLAVRFASPHDAFKVIYAAESLATALAETVVGDRFQAKPRRVLREEELALWVRR
ncbi:MAG: RES domain-containing protein [Phenylobacterium sp.]|uniref:RES domain-containing protein n=1 Tax=Phenylobacterium sp. TaxID=1871053 RepID=UPI0025FBED5C|nr:RES domain-containing protein [Phenylobacterium sp.]MBT9472898.1 RES domain-containing protein [Phenylobacterium sp.]